MSYFAGNYDIAVIGAGHAGSKPVSRPRGWGCKPSCSRSIWTPWATCPATRPSAARARGHLCASSTPSAAMGRGGRLLHPVPHAQPRQGPGRALPARAGRPPPLSGAHEAPARARAEPLSQAGRRHGDPNGGRARQRRRDAARREYRVRAVIVAAGTYLDSTVITGRCVLHSRPDGLRPALEPVPARLGLHAPLQDRNAPAHQRAQRRFLENGSPARRRRPGRSRFPPAGRRKIQAVSGAWTNEHTHAVIRESAPQPAVRQLHHRRRPALLPEHPRRRSSALPTSRATSSFWSRAASDGRAVPAGPVHEPAGGGAACHAAHHRGAGARRNAAPGLRHRI